LPSGGAPWTDTLGRNMSGTGGGSTTDYSGCPSNTSSAWISNYLGVNGGSLSIKTCSATYALQTNFHVSVCDSSSNCGVPTEATTNASMLVGVVVYNGTNWSSSPAWSFDYVSRNPGDPQNINYGDLSKVTLPTGGTITYTWGTDGLCPGAAPLVPV